VRHREGRGLPTRVIGQPHTILSGSRIVTQSNGMDPGEANIGGMRTRLRIQSRPEPPRGWPRTRTRPPATAARAGGRRSAVGSTRTAFSGSGSDYRDATDVDPQPSPPATGGRAAWSDHAVVVASRSRHAVDAPPGSSFRVAGTRSTMRRKRAPCRYIDHVKLETITSVPNSTTGAFTECLPLPRINDDLPAQRGNRTQCSD